SLVKVRWVLCMVFPLSVSDPLFRVYLLHLSGSRPIKNSRLRGKALCNISLRGLLGAAEAESIALAIDASHERDEALCNVAVAYASEHSWDAAERVARVIEDVQKRDEAWRAIA